MSTHARVTPGRTLPHSVESEEYLLSAAFLDGNEVLDKCVEAHVGAADFYVPKNAILFRAMEAVRARGGVVDIAVVAKELQDTRQLEEIGGFAFLAQITSLIPTTAQVPTFIESVKNHAVLRHTIRECSAAIEKVYDANPRDAKELLATTQTQLQKIASGANGISDVRTAGYFDIPPAIDPLALLGKNRYIGRGDSLLVVSSSGMGKSVLAVGWAVHCALGRDFLGIECRKPLTSLLIQSEDSDGDMGEMLGSMRIKLKLTDAEWALVDQRVHIVTDKTSRGQTFIARLRLLVEKFKPDLVWINPLHAYAGCDISDAKEMGAFLRAGLNVVNKDNKFAYIIIHHTPKPVTSKGVPDRKWHEFMYDAAGSAELVNWSRGVITLKPCETEGDFFLILAKRGKRAGAQMKLVSPSGTEYWEHNVTKIPIKQSQEVIEIEGRPGNFHLLNWETRIVSEEELKLKTNKGQFEKVYPDERFLKHCPNPDEAGLGNGDFGRIIEQTEKIHRKTTTRWLTANRGKLVTEDDMKLWKLTTEGKRQKDEILRNTP